MRSPRSLHPVRPTVVAVVLAAFAFVPGCRAGVEAMTPLQRVAFGSCAHQDQSQAIWDAVLDAAPDLFIFAGDNIYTDTGDLEEQRADYRTAAAVPGFQALKATCPVLATWDDHDYGANDAGAEFAFKENAQQAFIEFVEAPADSPLRKRPGVYDARVFGPPGRRVQVILLDTRYFRGPLVRREQRMKGDGPYEANPDTSSTLLGDAQWAWLEARLREPAELRLIVSSIQVLSEDHSWEKWMNLPHERERLFALLRETGAAGVIFLSGDRHHGELSRMDDAVGYPLYDLTSSGLNQGRGRLPETNRHRLGDICWPFNFGLVEVDWETGGDPVIDLKLVTVDGQVALHRGFRLSELQPAASATPAEPAK